MPAAPSSLPPQAAAPGAIPARPADWPGCVGPQPPARLAVLADLHGNLPALEALEAVLAAEGIVQAVLLGDQLAGPLWPAETAARLVRLGWPALAGNHERQMLAVAGRGPWSRPAHPRSADALAVAALDRPALEALRSLPARAAWGSVWACHGTPASDLQMLLHSVDDPARGGGPAPRPATDPELRARLGPWARPPAAGGPAVVLCGHSHLPACRTLPGGPLLLNPGSLGLPAYDEDAPHPHRVENGSPQARWALLSQGPDGRWQAALRTLDYDHEAAAARAEARGRGDWADALRSGRVGRREAAVLGLG